MQYPQRRKHLKYYKRILSTLLIVAQLFAAAAFGIYLFMANQLDTRSLEYSNQILTEQIKRNLDNSFNIVYRFVLKMKNEESIISYNSIRGGDVTLELKIAEMLDTYAGLFYDYDYDVAVFALDSGKVITDKEVTRTEPFLADKHIDWSDFEQYRSQAVWKNEFKMLHSAVQPSESLFFITPLFSDMTNNVFILVEYKVTDMLEKFHSDIGTGTQISVVDYQGDVLVPALPGEETGKQERRIIQGDNYFGFQYQCAYPVSGKGTLAMGIAILPVLAVVIAYVVSLLASKVLYQPISTTVKRFKEYNSEAFSDEFGFFNATIHKFEDANDELLRAMSHYKKSMRGSYLRELLRNSAYMEDIPEKLERYKITVLDRSFSVCIIAFHNFEELLQNFENDDLNDIVKNIQNILETELTKLGEFELIHYSAQIMVLIAPSDSEPNLKSFLIQLLLFIEVQYDINLVAFIGPACAGAREVSKAYEAALTVMECKLAFNNQKVIVYEEVTNHINNNLYYPLEMEQNLIEYALMGNCDKVYDTLHMLLEQNFISNSSGREMRQQFWLAMTMTIKRILYKANLRQEDVFDDESDLHLKLNLYEQSQDLYQFLVELFDKIFAHMEQERGKNSQKTINRILEYVRQNFKQDISLIDLSEQFNLTISYISRLFKSELQMNFKDIIAAYRLEEAKKLLAQDWKVQDVSAACGFNNTSVFIRFFKRFERMTPSEYQRGVSQTRPPEGV